MASPIPRLEADAISAAQDVGRAISPYLGFLTGWLMIAGTLIGTLSPVVALGPNVLAVFNAPTGNKWDNAILGTVLAAVMLIISVIGIRLSARTPPVPGERVAAV